MNIPAKKIMAAVLLLLSASALAFAEGRVPLRWLEKDYDFGVWKEAAGPRTGSSRFVNAGRDTVAVLDVRPSCGCTSASFTERPLAPGDTATVTYTYDPDGRPGRFEKSVKVYMSDGSRQVIHISGSVIGRPESLRMLYPLEEGEIFMTPLEQPREALPYGRTTSYFVSLYNAGRDSVTPGALSASKGLRVDVAAKKIGPGDTATFALYFDTGAHGAYGPVEIPVDFILDRNSAASPRMRQTFKALVVPDPAMIRDTSDPDAPRVACSPTSLDFGRASGSSPVVDLEFTVGNEGKKPLKIYSVYSDSEQLSVRSFPAKPIKKGKSAKVKVRLDTSLSGGGPVRRNIYIISNDPVTPMREVRVVGET